MVAANAGTGSTVGCAPNSKEPLSDHYDVLANVHRNKSDWFGFRGVLVIVWSVAFSIALITILTVRVVHLSSDKPAVTTAVISVQSVKKGAFVHGLQSTSFDPPPRSEKARTARYIVHKVDWGSVSVISASMKNEPFAVVVSFCDGPVDNSTGVPYFYLAAADPIVQNMKANPAATLSLSEAQLDYCKTHGWDPEEPLCSRVSLTGKLIILDIGSEEFKFARDALFSRHPVMRTWPKDHDWQTVKLSITHIWLQDTYGPADSVSVKEYLNIKL